MGTTESQVSDTAHQQGRDGPNQLPTDTVVFDEGPTRLGSRRLLYNIDSYLTQIKCLGSLTHISYLARRKRNERGKRRDGKWAEKCDKENPTKKIRRGILGLPLSWQVRKKEKRNCARKLHTNYLDN